MSILKIEGYNGNIYYTIINSYGYIFKSSSWETEQLAKIAYNNSPSYYESFGWSHYR